MDFAQATLSGRPQLSYTEIRFILSLYETSVSETIRKMPLTEAQPALEKQKIRSVKRGYLSRYRNSVKTASSRKISLKLGNRLLSYGRKRLSV